MTRYRFRHCYTQVPPGDRFVVVEAEAPYGTSPGELFVRPEDDADANFGFYADVRDLEQLDDEPVAGVDYDAAVCDNCGNDEHTPAELAVCVDSMVGPGPVGNGDEVLEGVAAWRPNDSDFVVLTSADFDRIMHVAEQGRGVADLDDVEALPLELWRWTGRRP